MKPLFVGCAKMQEYQPQLFSTFANNSWQNQPFSNPNAHIRLATVFSGIGAIEQAFKRLNLNHTIIFANDIDNFVKKSLSETKKKLTLQDDIM